MRKTILAGLAFVLLSLGCSVASAQSTQPFVISMSTAGYSGVRGTEMVAIGSTGFQLTSNTSLVYEFISNPADSSKPRVYSGLANYTRQASSFVPASVRSKLLVDLTNYLVTFQAGAGRESLAGVAMGAPRTSHVVGNFGVYFGRPVAAHAQLGAGYKFILGPGSHQVIKVPTASLTFTF